MSPVTLTEKRRDAGGAAHPTDGFFLQSRLVHYRRQRCFYPATRTQARPHERMQSHGKERGKRRCFLLLSVLVSLRGAAGFFQHHHHANFRRVKASSCRRSACTLQVTHEASPFVRRVRYTSKRLQCLFFVFAWAPHGVHRVVAFVHHSENLTSAVVVIDNRNNTPT